MAQPPTIEGKRSMNKEEAREQIRTRQLARLGALFAGFAHEIRNPLSTIGLNLQLVQEDFGAVETPRDKRVHKRLTVVEAEVARLQSILEDFLDYVRVPKLELESVALNPRLQDLVDFMIPEMDAKGVSLRFFADTAVGVVDVDPDLFRAVIDNLLRNALDACGRGDQVMLSTRAAGADVVVQVTDTGAGMTAEVVRQAFDPYFSTKKSGTGLGLPAARRSIELHGGTIDVSSEEGRGTQFTIRLPIRAAQRPTESPEAEDP
jgi:two-component system sensor histidine kinase HydH